MNCIHISKNNGIAMITLNRGKVNALNQAYVEQIKKCLEDLENDPEVQSVIVTGDGKFFSFGFDIPEFLSYSKESFIRYLIKFSSLYNYMFLFPKPLVAALNGHTIAGGCMLAIACDYRIMTSGKARISLNEIAFGSSVFAGSVDILKFCTGQRNAETILYSGAMYSAEEAKLLGLIDQVAASENLLDDAIKIARYFAKKDSAAFRSIKRHIRKPVADESQKKETDSLYEFANIWYSENTWKNLKEIKIYS